MNASPFPPASLFTDEKPEASDGVPAHRLANPSAVAVAKEHEEEERELVCSEITHGRQGGIKSERLPTGSELGGGRRPRVESKQCGDRTIIGPPISGDREAEKKESSSQQEMGRRAWLLE